MPNLGFVAVPGVGISVKDLHELDCSPTQTPAQTRSASPTKGSNMPHTHREAAEFITKLTSMATIEQASSTIDNAGHVKIGQEMDSSAHLPIASTNNPDELTLSNHPDKPTVTHDFDKQHSTAESAASKLTREIHSFVPSPTTAQAKMGGLAKTSAIDGSSSVSTTSKLQILLVYFMFNLGLTLYNKAVMIMFPYPFLLTALHAASGMAGTQLLLARGVFTLRNLSSRDTALLSAFSILYTANIAVSNVSLAMVTIPFHQTVRAMTPVFTVAIYRVIYHSIYSSATYISLMPVIIGVMLASYGDLTATTLGFFMTLLGTLLAALKTVTTNRLQTAGLHFGALELLHRMSPIACVQSLFVAYLTGEFDRFEPRLLGNKGALILIANGIIAFGLNVASFEANKRSGALTMTIAANVKQVLTVVLSVLIWHDPIGAMNACGIAMALVGGLWYGRVELRGKAGKTMESRMEEGGISKA